MSSKQFLSGTVAGGIAFFVLGYLMWGLAFMGFFEANTVGPMGMMKATPDFVTLGIGQLAFGAFLTTIFGKWATISTAQSGLKAGAMIGLLLGVAFDFTMYGTMNLYNMTAVIVDIALVTVQAALAGAVVGAVLGMTKD